MPVPKNAVSNWFFFFFKSRKKTCPLTLHIFLLCLFHISCCFLLVSITLMIAMALVQQKNKKYDLKFKLSVVKYAEENSEEAAARCLSEEDSSRARLPAGGRKKAREEPEINMRGWVISKRARHERVSRKMIRAMEKQMSATVSDSRDEEFAASAGWLNRFLHRNNFTCRRMPENSPRSWPSL